MYKGQDWPKSIKTQDKKGKQRLLLSHTREDIKQGGAQTRAKVKTPEAVGTMLYIDKETGFKEWGF